MDWRAAHALLASVLVIAVMWLYAPSWQYDFIHWDDDRLVMHNELIRSLQWRHLLRMFQFFDWELYTPVTFLSYAVDYRLWGQNPFGFHLMNALLHALTAVCVYGVLWRLTGSRWTTWMVTALFALHPVQVESVVWVSERKTVLCALFGMGALWVHVSSWGERRAGRWATCGLLAAALLAKPSAVSIGAGIVTYDWLVRRVRLGEALRRHAALLVMIAAAACCTLALHARGGALYPSEQEGVWEAALTMMVVWSQYAGMLYWPSSLAPLYDVPTVRSALDPRWLVACAAWLAVVGWLVRHGRTHRLAAWALAWTALQLLPVSGLVPISTRMNDRYLYLAALGVWGVSAAAVEWLLVRRVRWPAVRLGGLAGLALAAPCLCALLTLQQMRLWEHSVGFWSFVASRMPRTGEPWMMLAHAYADRDLDRLAEETYERALRHDVRRDGAIQNNLGNFYRQRGRIGEAVTACREAVTLNPDQREFQLNLAAALEASGALDEAEAVYRRAAARWSSDGGAGSSSRLAPRALADFLARRGRFDEARERYEALVWSAPDDPSARRGLARVLRHTGETEEAARLEREAAELAQRLIDTRGADAYLRRGIREGRRGSPEAVWAFKRAIALHPGLATAHYNLGVTYLGMDRRDLAEPSLTRAEQLGMDIPEGVRQQLEATP